MIPKKISLFFSPEARKRGKKNLCKIISLHDLIIKAGFEGGITATEAQGITTGWHNIAEHSNFKEVFQTAYRIESFVDATHSSLSLRMTFHKKGEIDHYYYIEGALSSSDTCCHIWFQGRG